jgi:hypothetical protein
MILYLLEKRPQLQGSAADGGVEPTTEGPRARELPRSGSMPLLLGQKGEEGVLAGLGTCSEVCITTFVAVQHRQGGRPVPQSCVLEMLLDRLHHKCQQRVCLFALEPRYRERESSPTSTIARPAAPEQQLVPTSLPPPTEGGNAAYGPRLGYGRDVSTSGQLGEIAAAGTETLGEA